MTVFFSLASWAIWSFLPKWLGRRRETRREQTGVPRDAARQLNEELERFAAATATLEKSLADGARELDDVRRRFHLALQDTGVSMSQQDCDLRYVWIHNAPHGLKKTEFLGQLQADVMPADLEPKIAQAKRQAMAERESVRIEIHTMIDGKPRWFDERISPVIRDGEIIGVMTTSIDTTIYRIQEEYLRELLRELTHRTKNLLAVILGIARQAGRTAPDVETFVAQFSGRIRALSITHELLVNANWSGVDLKSLLEAVWRTTAPLKPDRVYFDGAARRLAPESAQNLALAFHEMAANAASRGDMIGDGGVHVRIGWTPGDGEDDSGLQLVWEECADGLPGSNLDGFAKSYVETLLPRATGGSSNLVVTDGGLRWTLKLPARNFIS